VPVIVLAYPNLDALGENASGEAARWVQARSEIEWKAGIEELIAVSG
jgi:hypothetical protein